MLAGLVHGLGAIPICLFADRHHPRLDLESLESLIRKFHTAVGAKLLASWNFPQEIVDVVAQYKNLQHVTADGSADYVDIVTVANMMMPSTAKFVAWDNVYATARLGYTPGQCQNFLTTHGEQLSAVREMLGFTQSSAIKQADKIPPHHENQKDQSHEKLPDSKSGLLSGLFKIFK